jgi:hypothetical protein
MRINEFGWYVPGGIPALFFFQEDLGIHTRKGICFAGIPMKLKDGNSNNQPDKGWPGE